MTGDHPNNRSQARSAKLAGADCAPHPQLEQPEQRANRDDEHSNKENAVSG
jgi:hypothetical protein